MGEAVRGVVQVNVCAHIWSPVSQAACAQIWVMLSLPPHCIHCIHYILTHGMYIIHANIHFVSIVLQCVVINIVRKTCQLNIC